MRAVRLTRALVLEAAARVADGAGGFAEVWQVRGTVWAEVRPGAGRSGNALGAAVAVQPLRIVVRGLPAGHAMRPAAGMRFRDGARLFRLLAVTEADAGGRFLICAAEEVSG
ncbi:head-tail adaptor protein [Paragemmobacter ruber]|uniref:Head-tail adaptor protein n=1 Tax=Paragemmobacter ruber TaxID=1985673 RepID=A0ABW9Y950_9RHOB|nr:head-tail adaptor protein [Rhodobacter ruber]NBE08684.1 head-tail adaptor protein [Rhodobacter ruber]